MKKFYSSLSFIILLGFASCSDSQDSFNNEPSQENGVVDLSKVEMANCYIVQQPGTYKFVADNQFNLGEGLPVPPEIHPFDAKLVWQTEKSSIESVELDLNGDKPYIRFTVSEAKGNALIAALDEEGTTVWSWHIWMPTEAITSVTTPSGYEVMNLNLGAVSSTPGSASSYGMLYQWGRKDPFPAAGTLTGTTETLSAPLYDIDNQPVLISNSSWYSVADNNIEYSIANPTVVLTNYAQYAQSRDWLASQLSDDSLWGNPNGDEFDRDNDVYTNKGRKTCYDPSPAGWRVAPVDAFRHFTSTGGYAWDFDDYNIHDFNNDGVVDINDFTYGWHFMVNDETPLFFPAASRFDGSWGMLMGSMSGLWGNYWSNAPSSSVSGGAFCALSFQVKGQNGEDWISISPSGSASRADAYSVRCVRD